MRFFEKLVVAYFFWATLYILCRQLSYNQWLYFCKRQLCQLHRARGHGPPPIFTNGWARGNCE